jgi:hypothetical protein
MELEHYGVFKEDHKGPIWIAFFDDLDQAKTAASKLCEKEHAVFFIYCFQKFREVARFKPTGNK